MSTNPNFSDINISPPVWMGDFSSRDSILPAPAKLDPAQFLAEDAVKVVVGAAGAAVDAVSVPVDALSGPIPNGTVLDFGGKKFARLTAAAAKNATSLAVAALATALADDDTATYPGVGKKRAPSGTLVGRTYAERDAGTGYGPADVGTDDEIFLTAREAEDLMKETDMELYRHHRLVKENFLPGWADLGAPVKAKIRELYTCIKGEN